MGKFIIDLDSKLGEGQSAIVYKAIVEATKEAIAVKVMSKSKNSQDKRFMDALLY